MGEMEDMLKKHSQFKKEEAEREIQENAALIASFKVAALQQGVTLDDSHFQYITTIGIVASFPRLVTYLHPSLQPDKEGIFNFAELKKYASGKVQLSGISME